MRPLLSLESLEDRMLPSGVNAPYDAVLVHSASLPSGTAHLLAVAKTDVSEAPTLGAQSLAKLAVKYEEENPASEIQYLKQDQIYAAEYDVIVSDLDTRLMNFDEYQQSARESLSSVVRSLENEQDKDDGGLPGVRSAPPSETTSASVQNGPSAVSEVLGQPLALSAITSAENTSSPGTFGPGDGMVDLTGAAGFTDGGLLDAWQEGLPAPQPEPAPAAQNLTVVPTYLVGTPPATPATEIAPHNVTETGPTDFIIGFQDRQPAPATPPTATERGTKENPAVSSSISPFAFPIPQSDNVQPDTGGELEEPSGGE